jgi:hypothetical protein
MFRPAVETLERREVFSAGPLGIHPLNISGQGSGDPIPAESISFNIAAHGEGLAASPLEIYGNTAPRQFSGSAAADGTSNVLIALLLPYMEQDNVYRSGSGYTDTTLDDESFIIPVQWDYGRHAAAHDVIFAELADVGDRLPRDEESNQIIAILIGLAQSPNGAPTSLAGESKGLLASPEFFSLSVGTYGRNTATAFDRGYLFP